MSGWVAGIGAVGALGAGAMNLAASSKAAGQSGQSLQMAMQDYMLRKRMAEQQYELATAGQTDARGNRTRYVPGRGWVTDLEPGSQSLVAQSDALQRQQYGEAIGRGTDERRSAFNRRLDEGSAASPLLSAMSNRYGAPSREGVAGANAIANVTGASEAGDQARGGYAATALRTGSGSVPLQSTIAGIDRGATQGIRSALARSGAEAGPLYEQMSSQFNEGRLNPYNMLATRASNVENMPFSPESISGGLDAQAGARGRFAPESVAKGNAAFGGIGNPLMLAMASQTQPGYDKFIGGLTENAKVLFPKIFGSGGGGGRTYGDLSESGLERILSGGGLYS